MQLTEELARDLRRLYYSGVGKSIVPSLFGILNADRIRTCGSSHQSIVQMAGVARFVSRGNLQGSPVERIRAGDHQLMAAESGPTPGMRRATDGE